MANRVHTARASTVTTELLGLHPPRVGDQKRSVVGNKRLTKLKGRAGIVVLGEVCDESLGNSLSKGIDLRDVTTTRDAAADVDLGELVLANNEDRLVELPAKALGLNEGDGLPVYADKTLSLFAVSHSSGRLLLAEARNGRSSRHNGTGMGDSLFD